MNFKQYHKSNIVINSSQEDVKFRRYIEHDNQRLIQYIEGTLDKIEPRDFDNVTVIPSWSFSSDALEYSLLEPGMSQFPRYEVIEFNDNITQIGDDPDALVLSITALFNDIRVIFPSNLRQITGRIGHAAITNPYTIIWDFSKVKSIPTWTLNTGDSGFSGGTIIVPKNLLNNWKTANNWSEKADMIVAAS